MATDLAEFLGAAIGFNLLIGTSLFVSCVLTAIVAFALLALQRYGFRPFEAAIATLVGRDRRLLPGRDVLLAPRLRRGRRARCSCRSSQGSESVLLAVGILGATVMPHVIYLHSALTQDRIVPESQESARVLMRYTRIDVLVAMTIAGLINIAMLVMAASTFYKQRPARRRLARDRPPDARADPRRHGERAVRDRAARLGPLVVGRRHARRPGRDAGLHPAPDPASGCGALVTMIPAFVVVALGINPTRTLVLSQVVLSFGIPFALIPLVWFTSRRDVMGDAGQPAARPRLVAWRSPP